VATFLVNTSGPSYLSHANDLDSAVALVLERLPLRRGWTHEVEESLVAGPDGFHRAAFVRVVSSTSTVVKGHGAVVYALKSV